MDGHRQMDTGKAQSAESCNHKNHGSDENRSAGRTRWGGAPGALVLRRGWGYGFIEMPMYSVQGPSCKALTARTRIQLMTPGPDTVTVDILVPPSVTVLGETPAGLYSPLPSEV